VLRLHDGQFDLAEREVAAVVADRFPRWAGLPITQVASAGTVNALFRLGDEVVLRVPLFPDADPDRPSRIRETQETLRRVGRRMPVRLPELLAIGGPHTVYPGWTAVYRWLDGEPVSTVTDQAALALDLAVVVTAFRSTPIDGRAWNGASRGGPLAPLDDDVRGCLEESAGLVDVPALTAVWDDALTARRAEPDAWIHTDLMPGNLLARNGRLVAVLDCEDLAVGDPAVDAMPAWNLLEQGSRAAFRRAAGFSTDAWRRGRGWALAQAIIALPYYLHTNPSMVATARTTLTALLRDR
jgi:aminoglycoside phosphotransferase (APT) family kinase protein